MLKQGGKIQNVVISSSDFEIFSPKMRPFELFFDLEQFFVQFEALKRNFARSRSEVKAAKESTWLTRHFLQEKL